MKDVGMLFGGANSDAKMMAIYDFERKLSEVIASLLLTLLEEGKREVKMKKWN